MKWIFPWRFINSGTLSFSSHLLLTDPTGGSARGAKSRKVPANQTWDSNSGDGLVCFKTFRPNHLYSTVTWDDGGNENFWGPIRQSYQVWPHSK